MKTHEQLKDAFRSEDARGRQAIREMCEDVLGANPTSEYHLSVITALDALAAEGSVGRPTLKDMGDQASHRRTGGSTGANQYGAYTVRYATDRQAGFLRSLLETRDYSGKDHRVRAEIEKAARELGTGQIAKRLASDAIDALLTCPEIEGTSHENPATERQIETIRNMVDRKVGGREALDALGTEVEKLSRTQASALLDQIMKAEWKPRRTERLQTAEVEAGIYLIDGDVVKVQKAVHGSGHMYAKVLNPETAKFEFVSGAIRRVRPEHKMTLEQAKEYGALYGICCNCGRTLTDETSVERAIGPKCAKRFG